jgi:hypothetical protein
LKPIPFLLNINPAFDPIEAPSTKQLRLRKALNKNSTLAVLVDFKAGFDSVWRVKVIEKMSDLKVPTNIL